LELRAQLAVIRRHGLLIVFSMLIAAAVAAALSLALPKTYQAEATLLIGNAPGAANPTLDQVLLSQRIAVTYADLATQRATLQRVIDELKLNVTADKLGSRVTADAPQDSSVVLITVRDSDAAQSAAIANAIAEDVISSTPRITGRDPSLDTFIQQSLTKTQTQIEDTQTQIAALSGLTTRTPDQDAELSQLQSRMASLQSAFATLLAVASSASSNLATISDPAVPPTDPAAPSPALNVALAIVAGLLVGLGLAFVREQFDDSVRDQEEVERLSGLRTLSSIGTMLVDDAQPKLYWLEALLRPRTPVAEAFRTLRTNLEFAAVDEQLTSLLVTSAAAGDGKTTVAANLALVFAQSGRKTILVDADFRRPTVHELFRVLSTPGITSTRPWTDDALAHLLAHTEEPNLRLLPAGPIPPNPLELLGSHWMDEVFAALRATGDLIIFDSPPLGLVSDAAIIATKVDATILVVSPHRTSRTAFRRSVDALRQANATVVGLVLNRTGKVREDSYSVYYRTGPEVAPSTAEVAAQPRPDSG
jgi:non-specific protein-tyrosine kinase